MIDFPKWVRTSACDFRSQTVVTTERHGVTSHAVKVSNKDLPMVFEKKMARGSVLKQRDRGVK